MLITYRLETTLEKNRILELYLNVVEWGPRIYGAEAASQYYFHKSAEKLSISEAIRLASILNNPLRFSPLDDKNIRIKRKQLYIAMKMLHNGWINKEEFEQSLKELSIHHPEELSDKKWITYYNG